MTRVRWTTDAADDLARIVERIREDNPEAARRVAALCETLLSPVFAVDDASTRTAHGVTKCFDWRKIGLGTR